MSDQPNAAGTIPDPTTNTVSSGNVTISGTGTTNVLPEDPTKKAIAEALEWKTRFAGLQGKYQQEQQKWVESSAKLLEIDEQYKKLSGELEAIRAESAKALEEKDTYFTDLELRNAELDRLKIITKEFPHLLPLLGATDEDDVLPDGTGDELRGKLKKMSESIESYKKGAVVENLSGASPSAPPPSIKGSEALLKQAITAMREGKTEEYNNLYSQYIEQQSKNPGG